jgi:hypothetical protein
MLTLASTRQSLHPVAGVVEQRNLHVVFPRCGRLFGTKTKKKSSKRSSARQEMAALLESDRFRFNLR